MYHVVRHTFENNVLPYSPYVNIYIFFFFIWVIRNAYLYTFCASQHTINWNCILISNQFQESYMIYIFKADTCKYCILPAYYQPRSSDKLEDSNSAESRIPFTECWKPVRQVLALSNLFTLFLKNSETIYLISVVHTTFILISFTTAEILLLSFLKWLLSVENR